jgi:hypothetical protein
LKNALAILKLNCDEKARQNFRMALTLVAPVKVSRGNRHGMSRKVAERLGIDRQAAPFMESVIRRAEIDAEHSTWLGKGYDKDNKFQDNDLVACKHATGHLKLNPRPGVACCVLIKGNKYIP